MKIFQGCTIGETSFQFSIESLVPIVADNPVASATPLPSCFWRTTTFTVSSGSIAYLDAECLFVSQKQGIRSITSPIVSVVPVTQSNATTTMTKVPFSSNSSSLLSSPPKAQTRMTPPATSLNPTYSTHAPHSSSDPTPTPTGSIASSGRPGYKTNQIIPIIIPCVFVALAVFGFLTWYFVWKKNARGKKQQYSPREESGSSTGRSGKKIFWGNTTTVTTRAIRESGRG